MQQFALVFCTIGVVVESKCHRPRVGRLRMWKERSGKKNLVQLKHTTHTNRSSGIDADFHQDVDWEDDYVGGGAFGLYRQREGQDSRQRRDKLGGCPEKHPAVIIFRL